MDVTVHLPTKVQKTLQCGITASEHACFLSCLAMGEFYDMGTEDPTSIEDYDIMRSPGVLWANAAHFILRTTFEDIVRHMTQALPSPDSDPIHPTSIEADAKVRIILQCTREYEGVREAARILTKDELVGIHDIVCDLVINNTPFPTRRELKYDVGDVGDASIQYAIVLWCAYVDACGACYHTPDNGEGGSTTPSYLAPFMPTSETDPSTVIPFTHKDDTRDDN